MHRTGNSKYMVNGSFIMVPLCSSRRYAIAACDVFFMVCSAVCSRGDTVTPRALLDPSAMGEFRTTCDEGTSAAVILVCASPLLLARD